ncbi:hypothetical protein GCM10009826_43160 [Humibacillus xanthopallidus]
MRASGLSGSTATIAPGTVRGLPGKLLMSAMVLGSRHVGVTHLSRRATGTSSAGPAVGEAPTAYRRRLSGITVRGWALLTCNRVGARRGRLVVFGRDADRDETTRAMRRR